MSRCIFLVMLAGFFLLCTSQQSQQAIPKGLVKIPISNQNQVDQLRQAGAQIIVQQPDYVVARVDSMTSALSMRSEPIQEKDLVQRLVYIYLPDSSALQKVVNQGIDLWQVKGDTVIARAYDIYINRLRDEGFKVDIIAQDASKWREQQ